MPTFSAVLLLGFDNLNGPFGSLPTPLAFLGMPGCHLRLRVDATVPLLGTGGAVAFELPIPADPDLGGVRFHQQALMPDPGAGNGARMVISDAATAVIGL